MSKEMILVYFWFVLVFVLSTLKKGGKKIEGHIKRHGSTFVQLTWIFYIYSSQK